MRKVTPVFLWWNALPQLKVALKIGVNPSLSRLKNVSETASWRTKVVGVVGGMDTGPKCARAEESKVTNMKIDLHLFYIN